LRPSRLREIAGRLRTGAGTRARIVRQFLLESLMFSGIAGVLGSMLAMWGLWAIQSLVASQLPPDAVLTLNWRALLFNGAVTMTSAVLVGLAPALESSRSDVAGTLKDGARGSSCWKSRCQ
jgi:ABC-type antimicrobial peptide transport system permease subunit